MVVYAVLDRKNYGQKYTAGFFALKCVFSPVFLTLLVSHMVSHNKVGKIGITQ